MCLPTVAFDRQQQHGAAGDDLTDIMRTAAATSAAAARLRARAGKHSCDVCCFVA